jgi:hypothetical protein
MFTKILVLLSISLTVFALIITECPRAAIIASGAFCTFNAYLAGNQLDDNAKRDKTPMPTGTTTTACSNAAR